MPAIELGGRPRVQRDARDPRALGDAPRLEVGEVLGVDPLAHLDREGKVAGRVHRTLYDVAEQVELPGQRRPPALARDFRHGASEIQIDVIGAIFGDEHGHGFGHRLRVDAIELDAARHLGFMMLN